MGYDYRETQERGGGVLHAENNNNKTLRVCYCHESIAEIYCIKTTPMIFGDHQILNSCSGHFQLDGNDFYSDWNHCLRLQNPIEYYLFKEPVRSLCPSETKAQFSGSQPSCDGLILSPHRSRSSPRPHAREGRSGGNRRESACKCVSNNTV